MTQTINPVEADRALKAKHRAMWALGDYAASRRRSSPTLGPSWSRRPASAPGHRVLDVAAGSGQRRLPGRAHRRRASWPRDLTPELLETGRQRAERRAPQLEWREADAEHAAVRRRRVRRGDLLRGRHVRAAPPAAADELVRVCRPGGTIGLISWTPEGFIGQMFATMKPYAPPPPPGRSRRRCGATRSTSASCSATGSPTSTPGAGAARRPVRDRRGVPRLLQDATTARPSRSTGRIADDPERTAALDHELADLGRPLHLDDDGDGAGSTSWSPPGELQIRNSSGKSVSQWPTGYISCSDRLVTPVPGVTVGTERPLSRTRVLAPLVTVAVALALSGIVVSSPSYALDSSVRIPDKAWVTITGHGYGHGHGMSQYGAEGAARRGLTAQQIISFYYPGTRAARLTAYVSVPHHRGWRQRHGGSCHAPVKMVHLVRHRRHVDAARQRLQPVAARRRSRRGVAGLVPETPRAGTSGGCCVVTGRSRAAGNPINWSPPEAR